MAIVIVPPYPQRNDPNFATVADSWNAQLPTWTDQVNAMAVTVAANAATATTQAGIATTQAELATTNGAAQVALATTQANNAANSAASAASTAGVTKWVSGTSYTEGNNVWSPTDFKTYRRKITGAGTTDPSSDSTNWQSLIVSSEMVLLSSATANNSATIDFTGLDSTYYKYVVEFSAVRASIDSTSMLMQIKSGDIWRSSGYIGQIGLAQASFSASPSNNAMVFDYSNQFSTSSNIYGKMEIYNPSYSDRPTLINSFILPSLAFSFSFKTYQYNVNAATTGVRFLMESGNIASGTFKLYGLKA